MNCSQCGDKAVMSISVKCDDRCYMSCNGWEHNGYVLKGFGVGSGDYLYFDYCLSCGQIQNHNFVPVPEEPKEEENEG